MIGKMIKALILMTACIALVSCSTDSRSLLEGKAIDSLTDKALNKNSNSGSDKTAIQGKGAKSKGKYSGAATGDEHYIDDDVIFVSKDAFSGSNWINISPAKVMTPATAKTKNEGQYMLVQSGDEIWTKNSWKTRIAKESELKIGLVIIAFDRRDDEGVCQPPEDKEQALRDIGWYMAKITDMSNKYRGYINLSGGWKVAIEDIRVITK